MNNLSSLRNLLIIVISIAVIGPSLLYFVYTTRPQSLSQPQTIVIGADKSLGSEIYFSGNNSVSKEIPQTNPFVQVKINPFVE